MPEGQQLVADASTPRTSISLELSMSDGAFAGALRRILWSMARSANLVRLASAGGDAPGELVEAVVEINREAIRRRSPTESARAAISPRHRRRNN